MVNKRASRLYQEGKFNHVTITVLPDGSHRYDCCDRRSDQLFSFTARNLGHPDEQILDDPELEVADAGAPLAAPPEP